MADWTTSGSLPHSCLKNMLAKFFDVRREVELTKEECLANGMSKKEYDIQKALGSLPTKEEIDE